MGTAGGNWWTRVGCRDSQRHWPSPHIQAARDPWLFRLKISLVICMAVAKFERAAFSHLQRGLEEGRRQIFCLQNHRAIPAEGQKQCCPSASETSCYFSTQKGPFSFFSGAEQLSLSGFISFLDVLGIASFGFAALQPVPQRSLHS